MNTYKFGKRLLVELLLVVAMIAVFCGMFASECAAQNTPIYLPYNGDLLSANGPITLQVGTTNAAGVTNLTGQKFIKLPPRTSIAFFTYVGGAGGATTSNITVQLAVSPLGKLNSGAYTGTNGIGLPALFNTTSETGLQLTTTLNGTNGLTDFNILNYTNWDGALAMEILSISNQSTNATPPVVSNIWYSFQALQY